MSPNISPTFTVATTWKAAEGAPEWRVEAGYGSIESAREHVRQLRGHWAKTGRRGRVFIDEQWAAVEAAK